MKKKKGVICMSELVRTIMSKDVGYVNIYDTVQKAFEVMRRRGTKKIVVRVNNDFWIPDLWILKTEIDPKITLKQVFNERQKIFTKVPTVSPDKEISEIISDLYEFPEIIVVERLLNIKKVVGSVSLSDYLHLKKEVKKPVLDREKIERKVRNKESLMGISLYGDYSGIDLRKADLREADLSGSKLIKANLREADLSYANLSGADTDLREAKLIHTKLRGANLTGATLVNADLRYAKLWNANLEKANLNNADLSQAVLFNANLKSAKLKGANLFNAGLVSARLDSADFRGANLINTDFKYAKVNKESDFTGAELNWLTRQTLTERIFEAKWDREVYDPKRKI